MPTTYTTAQIVELLERVAAEQKKIHYLLNGGDGVLMLR